MSNIIQVKIPDIGADDAVEVIEILVKEGETIEVEQSLITVESDKASMEIPSSDAGVVKSIKVKLGDKVKEGSLVLELEAAEGAQAAPAAPATGGTADAATMQQLTLAAQAIQSQAPIQQGPTTITGARVEGSTLVTAMTLAVPLSSEMTSQMGTQLSGQVCQNPALGQLSRAGASFAYEITDSNSQVHRVDVAPC